MPQKAAPDADSHVGNWEDEGAATTNLYQSIDEDAESPSTADYVTSELSPSSSPYVARLNDPEDPQSSTGHIIRIHHRKDAAGGETIDGTTELRMTYVSEASQGTLIATLTTSDVSDSWTTSTTTLSGAEADAITDYTALFLRFVANVP